MRAVFRSHTTRHTFVRNQALSRLDVILAQVHREDAHSTNPQPGAFVGAKLTRSADMANVTLTFPDGNSRDYARRHHCR